jgi:hypothetical protein
MLVTAFTVWLQALASLAFLVRYTATHRWWTNVQGRVLGGMTICLFVLTLDLAIVDSNEGLGNTPIPVLLGRLGFGAVMLYGVLAMDKKA